MLSGRNISIDVLIESARACLKEAAGSVPVSLPEVSFWLVKRDLVDVAEERVKIKDVSEMKPGSKIDMEILFVIANVTYRLTIKTVITQDGVFQLRHSELTHMTYVTDWDKVRTFAEENAVSLAGFVLSLFNAALNLNRMKIS